jgi:hypothetical protein
MGWVPVSNVEFPKLATPFVPTVTAPSVVGPSLKVTAPVGGILLCNPETVAVKVMGCRGRAGLGEAVSVDAVSVPSTHRFRSVDTVTPYQGNALIEPGRARCRCCATR